MTETSKYLHDVTREGFSADQRRRLEAPLDEKRIKDREGRGNKTFSYLETWDVEDRANQIFGFEGWSSETVEMVETWSGERNGKDAIAFRAKVRITVYIGDRAVVKEAWGYGDGSGNDIGQASELAVKESESDAAKRAFKKFGWQFGLALYDKSHDNPNIAVGSDEDVVEAQREPAPEQTSPPPAPPPPAATKPPPKDKPAPRGGRVKADAPSGEFEPKKFTAPRFDGNESSAQMQEIWQKWSRQIATAIADAPTPESAREVVKLNIKCLNQIMTDTGKDAVSWVGGLIAQRWPDVVNNAPQQAPKPDAQDPPPAQDDEQPEESPEPNYNDIAPPEDMAVPAWDDWLDLVVDAIEKAPDIASARDVKVANKTHLDRASVVCQFDAHLFIQNKIDARFPPRGRGGR